MASNFVFNYGFLVCTTVATDVYTCPSGTTSVVFTLQAANVTTTADVLTVYWTSSANGNAVTRLVYETPAPAGESQGVLTGRLVLQPGDKVVALCGIPDAIELTLCCLELS